MVERQTIPSIVEIPEQKEDSEVQKNRAKQKVLAAVTTALLTIPSASVLAKNIDEETLRVLLLEGAFLAQIGPNLKAEAQTGIDEMEVTFTVIDAEGNLLEECSGGLPRTEFMKYLSGGGEEPLTVSADNWFEIIKASKIETNYPTDYYGDESTPVSIQSLGSEQISVAADYQPVPDSQKEPLYVKLDS